MIQYQKPPAYFDDPIEVNNIFNHTSEGQSRQHEAKNYFRAYSNKLKHTHLKEFEYKRKSTGTAKLIFGSMLLWGMNGITAYLCFSLEKWESSKFMFEKLWIWFTVMSLIFFFAGSLMHKVKRWGAAYVCWLTALVPILLGCYYFVQYIKKVQNSNGRECEIMGPWFALLSVMHLYFGSLFYCYKGEGFTMKN